MILCNSQQIFYAETNLKACYSSCHTVVSRVILRARHALVKAMISASRALFQGSFLFHRVSPNVQLECFTARLLIVVSRVTQLASRVVDHLVMTATLVKVFNSYAIKQGINMTDCESCTELVQDVYVRRELTLRKRKVFPRSSES